MTLSQATRKGLFYTGLIELVGATHFVSTDQRAVVLLLIVVGLVSIAFAFRRMVCPKCGKSMRQVSAELSHCGYCGTAYDRKEDAQPDSSSVRHEAAAQE